MRKSGFIDKIDDFSDRSSRFINDHSKEIFIVGTVIIFLISHIPIIKTEGFNLYYSLAMLFIAPMISWMMFIVYFLPLGLLQLICYCVKNPIEALLALLQLISILFICFLFMFYLYSMFYSEE